MTNRIKLVLGLIVIAGTFLYFNQKQSGLVKQVTKGEEQLISQETKNNKNKAPTVGTPKQNLKQKHVFSEPELDILIEELSGLEYSSDPMVELFSIAFELKNCKKAQRNIRKLRSTEKGHLEFVDQVKDHCKSRFDQHSDLILLMESNKVKNLVKNKILDSPYTDLISKIESRQIDPIITRKLIDMFLNSNNAQMIVALTDLPYSIKDDYLTDMVSESLQSNYPEYIETLTKQALMVHSCQFNSGVTCKSSTVFMIDKCLQDNELCGKDITHWFNHYLSEGHKADLKLAIDSIHIKRT